MAASERVSEYRGASAAALRPCARRSPTTLFDDASWAEPAAPLSAVRRSSTSGAVYETSGPESRGSRTPWWWSTQLPTPSPTLVDGSTTKRVCAYWPEFAQDGKERITVRQLLAHQAGLFAFNEPVDRSLVADLDRLAVVLARQKPAWEPGTRQAYHALSLGFYEGELLRRVDPQHRSLGQFFEDEIASRLGEDVYIRLPETIPNSRLATLALPSLVGMLRGFGLRFMLQVSHIPGHEAAGHNRSARTTGMAERTPNALASYEAAQTTERLPFQATSVPPHCPSKTVTYPSSLWATARG